MGKSKHPGLIGKAVKDVNRVKGEIAKTNKWLKSFSDACNSGSKVAKALPKNFNDVLVEMQSMVEVYVAKAAEIAAVEQREAEARKAGDKAKMATLKKKLAALEKEADKMRADYGGMGDVLQALSGTMEAELTAIAGYLNSYGDHAQW
ncbi:MAG: hypothetical protein CML68_04535 [Rhodobacteraceae bacterium]|nr:hypothetical protein [Paracoccaceae bacterium]